MNKIYLLWIYVVTLTAFVAASVITMIEEQRLSHDATSRLMALSATIENQVSINFDTKRYNRIARLVQQLSEHNNIAGLAVCDNLNRIYLGFPKAKGWEKICQSTAAQKTFSSSVDSPDSTWTQTDSSQRLQYYTHPLLDHVDENDDPYQFLIVVQDLSHYSKNWFESFFKVFGITWLGGFLLMLLIANQIRQWVKSNLKQFHTSIRTMIGRSQQALPKSNSSKVSALPASFRDHLYDKKLTVIANREPYIHKHTADGQIEVVRPASGLVTALEPILRVFGGLWIAHASGSADLDVANADGEVNVPPSNPKYTLRRVPLSKEEELGYYYGFSNEGLWPLCHLAYTRPTFRLSDWGHYQNVNQRFTDSIPSHALEDKALILVQDYHFALVPKLIRKRPDFQGARIGVFWHIPWPNSEAFGICPWNRELLHGMLGADVIGFHTQYHCNNFLETCNRYLEARIDWERFSVTMDNHETCVRSFPIGIETSPVKALSDEEVSSLKKEYGIQAEFVAVGVDRLDYTKGLVERIEGVERFLEKHPEYIGKFTLAQVGSPSRSDIPAYKSLVEQLEQTVNRVNQRFGNSSVKPILFLHRHFDWEKIQYFYQIGDVCMVTSLHDGMNLVAKEYVWCQRPERGSLILSKFTGASRELTEALIVNPYAIEELADALAVAISMPIEERRKRMLAMKSKIETYSAFHWAADLIRALMTKEDTFLAQLPKLGHRDRSLLTKAS
jgi:alpha,alpha-trehalose-phosphate synthase [UDP-forming]